ncbi:hypothetical protein OH768_23560 [Streptomyces sp. NBC_01622]|uniref:hypothetical protein n=1 Tax=Streptomyces sp. NBC_01622 TaxID=2975903 RepID=UPI0038641643|nr:hypothetical protein OH768_23560 [Streptomyces sp. NBC_01622]
MRTDGGHPTSGAAEADGWLRPAGAVPSVLRTIQLVGVDALVDCYLTLPQALGR